MTRSEAVKKMWDEIKSGKRQDHFHTQEWRRKSRERVGDSRPGWTGDAVSYRALHKWIHRRKGMPDVCVNCGLKAKDWASKNKKYERNPDEFVALCRSCHVKLDRYKSIKL